MAMGNLHYQNRNGAAGTALNAYTTCGNDVQSWHTYGVDWVTAGMTFYIDGKAVGSVSSQSSYADWPYNTNEYYIIINLALGGILGGCCFRDGSMPQCNEFLDIDWVRVF